MYINVLGSYRDAVSSGLTAGVAAGTATAGHILVLRNADTAKYVRLRALEVEALVTTAFNSAQEIGWDAYVLRGFSAAYTGGTALTLATNDGKLLTGYPTTVLTGRVADTGALTAGTQTLDANAIARGSVYTSAIGTSMSARRYDFTFTETEGYLLGPSEGVVVRNTIAQGAGGAVKWHFAFEYDVCLITGQ